MALAMTDPSYASMAEEVRAAEQQLIIVAGQEPGKWWDPYELRKKARNGWSAGAMGIALDNLIADRVFQLNTGLRVRLRG